MALLFFSFPLLLLPSFPSSPSTLWTLGSPQCILPTAPELKCLWTAGIYPSIWCPKKKLVWLEHTSPCPLKLFAMLKSKACLCFFLFPFLFLFVCLLFTFLFTYFFTDPLCSHLYLVSLFILLLHDRMTRKCDTSCTSFCASGVNEKQYGRLITHNEISLPFRHGQRREISQSLSQSREV